MKMTPADKGIMAAKMESLKTQITPGPWTVEKHEKSTVSMGGQCVIVAPAPDGASYGEQVANARLIASAPELLEALKDCLRHIEIGEGHKAGDFECVLAARAAIAAAEA